MSIKKMILALMFSLFCTVARPNAFDLCNNYCGGAPFIPQFSIVKSSGGDGADCSSSTGINLNNFPSSAASTLIINKNPNSLYSVTSSSTDSCVSSGFLPADQTFFVMAVDAAAQDSGTVVVGSGNTDTQVEIGFSNITSRKSSFPAMIYSNACLMNSVAYCFLCTCGQ